MMQTYSVLKVHLLFLIDLQSACHSTLRAEHLQTSVMQVKSTRDAYGAGIEPSLLPHMSSPEKNI